MKAILLTLCAIVPHKAATETNVDVIEVNRYYDDRGELVFRQLIFWEWHEGDDYHVRAWRMLKSDTAMPLYDHARGGASTMFVDDGVLRCVRAASVRESHTQHDPELLDRRLVPQSQRRGLNP